MAGCHLVMCMAKDEFVLSMIKGHLVLSVVNGHFAIVTGMISSPCVQRQVGGMQSVDEKYAGEGRAG